jgi:hypothetical protein
MKHVMVKYTTRPDQAEENARLITEVFASLRRTAPAGLTYASYRLDDGVSFVHIASVDDPDNNPLPQLAEFKTFVAGVRGRCENPPATSALHEIGSYSAHREHA